MVNMEGSPWCFPCEEPHWEHECLRQREEEDPGFTDRLNFIDTLTLSRMMNTLTSQKRNLKKLGNGQARQARLEILNQMDEPLKERLRKKEKF
jgi:5-methylthioribose kinase